MKHTIAAIFLLMTSACATSVQVTKLKDVDCNGNGPTPELFTKDEKPSKPYEKFAIVTADNQNNSSISESTMFDALKKKGSSICADALLVQDMGNSSGTLGLETITTIRAVAVKYK
jgi:hypothetical protein